MTGAGTISLGRTWFGIPDPYNYDYVPGRGVAGQVESMVGIWEPPAGSTSVASWLIAHQNSKGCFREVFLFAMPLLETLP